MKRLLKSLMLGAAILGLMAACGGAGGGSNSLTVGTQTYTETKIIGYMYKELIEDATDVSVDIKFDLATSPVVIKAMQNDELQISTQYTGTALDSFFSLDTPDDPEATLEQAKREFGGEEFNFKWLDPIGFENTYALTVRSELAEEHNLEKLSDIKDIAGDLKAGFDTSWLERDSDGYPAFAEKYGFEFGTTLPMEIGLVYDAVKNEEVDIVLAYSTDARISAYDLVILEDDLNFFPPYDASPVLTNEAAEEYPEVVEAIEQLVGKIDVTTIGELNGRVDLDGEDPEDVAIDYLKEIGLLE